MLTRRSVLFAIAAFAAKPAAAQIRLPGEMRTVDRRIGRSGGDAQGAPLWLVLTAGQGPLGTVLVATRHEPADPADQTSGFLVARLDGGASYEVDTRAMSELSRRSDRETNLLLAVALDPVAFEAVAASLQRVRARGRSADHTTVMGWLMTAARLARLTTPRSAPHPAGFVRALVDLNR